MATVTKRGDSYRIKVHLCLKSSYKLIISKQSIFLNALVNPPFH